MKCSRSPIIENTICRLVEEDDSFSDKSFVDSFRDISSYDDTDIDYDYGPINKLPS